MKKQLYLAVCAMTILMVLLSGCSTNDSLVGKWESYNDELGINSYNAIEFTEDGKWIDDLYTIDYNVWNREIIGYSIKDNNLYLNGIETWSNGGYSTSPDYNSETTFSIDGTSLTIGKAKYTKVSDFKYQYEESEKK